MKNWKVFMLSTILLFGCIGRSDEKIHSKDYSLIRDNPDLDVATFAGGCFWCIEASFESTEGVVEAISGYTGGIIGNPTYKQVSSGATSHYEAVQVYYNPKIVGYDKLLEVFFFSIDPTDDGGQFADRGTQYRTAIFFHSKSQEKSARDYIKDLNESGKFDKPIVVEVLPSGNFYDAEEYHQDYHIKAATKYSVYKKASGRQGFIDRVWKKN